MYKIQDKINNDYDLFSNPLIKNSSDEKFVFYKIRF